MIKFDGEAYFDDRLYVLYLCKGIVSEGEHDGTVVTTIYHEQPPKEYIWCLLTYRNCNRYPLASINHFQHEEDATDYLKRIEPETPLISLNGNSPRSPLIYEKYVEWKRSNNFAEYDYKSLYLPGGTNPTETIYQTKEQFKGVV